MVWRRDRDVVARKRRSWWTGGILRLLLVPPSIAIGYDGWHQLDAEPLNKSQQMVRTEI